MVVNSLPPMEQIIGGIAAILVTIYGVYKKFKSDNVTDTYQRSEIDIFESLSKQRDDLIILSDKYRELLTTAENEIREIKNNLSTYELENSKLIQRLSEAEAEIEVLKQILQYINDSVSVTRQSLEANSQ